MSSCSTAHSPISPVLLLRPYHPRAEIPLTYRREWGDKPNGGQRFSLSIVRYLRQTGILTLILNLLRPAPMLLLNAESGECGWLATVQSAAFAGEYADRKAWE